MNEITKPTEQSVATGTIADIMTNPQLLQQAGQLAESMASSKVTVPQHLRGSVGDCYAITLQAVQWGMNPFVVAQKTHVVNGALGYEAQLVNAVVQSSGLIVGSFKYEHKGDSCRVGAQLKGDDGITWGEWLSASSVQTKNSPLWKTNPKQQLGYLQVKNWARLYAPAAILGVYTPDELSPDPAPREMGAAEVVKPDYPQDKLEANADKWREAISSGRRTPADVVAMVSTKYTLNEEQIKAIEDLDPVVSDDSQPEQPLSNGADNADS